jgi:hypothetical protein
MCGATAGAAAAAAATGVADNPAERRSDSARPPGQSLVVWAWPERNENYEWRSIQSESADCRFEDNTDRLCRESDEPGKWKIRQGANQ